MRRTAAAVGLLTLLLAVPALADPTPSATPEPEDPLKVSVTDLLPRAPQAGQAFEVKGAIRNRGTRAVTAVQVRLGRGSVITARGVLHQLEQDGADITQHFTSRRLTSDSLGRNPIDALAPGAVGYFDIQTDVDSLQLHETGVYPFDIEARGAIGTSGVQLLGAVPTWVPFFTASSTPQQNKVAVVWPVTDQPHQAPDGTFVDDQLATSFAQGRLQHVLYAPQLASTVSCDPGATRNDGVHDPRTTRCLPVPVTFAVDPDLVSAGYAMTGPAHYTFGSGKAAKQGTGRDAAAAWLSSLKAQVAAPTGSVLALPYADPDVDALASSAAGRADLDAATTLGNDVIKTQLGATPIDGVYPPTQGTGVLTQDAADALTPQRGGRFAYILDESAFPDLEDSGRIRSPSAPVTLGSSRTTNSQLYGLVADDVLSTLVLGPTHGQEGSRLAEQRFIAETAIMAAEAPGLSRTFVIAPDRYSDPDVRAATESLRDIGRLPWLCPISLEPATQGTESCPGATSGPTSQQYTDEDDPRTALRQGTDAQLPSRYLGAVATAERRGIQLTTEVLDDSAGQPEATRTRIRALRTQLRQAVARAESSAWRQDPAGQDAQITRLNQEVNSLVGNVIVLGGRLLLTSSKGTVQVSVQNQLDLPVQVRLRFTFPGRPPVETGLISVAGKRSVPASVKAVGLRSGSFPVDVQMYDRAGKVFRGKATVLVRSTRYGRLALGVTFAAAAVLFLAAGARIVRRAFRKPADTTGDSTGDSAGDTA
ncbi:MAG: hypothetical protein JWP14_1438 [Frankiales bacterium]|nr:hypothetical protein [Frankiales bacterium]